MKARSFALCAVWLVLALVACGDRGHQPATTPERVSAPEQSLTKSPARHEHPPGHTCSHCQRLADEGVVAEERSVKQPSQGDVSEPATLEQLVREFATSHGVKVESKNGEFEYRILVAGKSMLLTKGPASKQGLADADKKISELVDEKIKELEQDPKLKVKFSRDDEDVTRQWVKSDDGSWGRGSMVKSRRPRIHELYGIEACLWRASPSNWASEKTQGVKFYFLLDDYTKGERPLAYFISGDKDDRPAIYYLPGACDGRVITEQDVPFTPDRVDGHGYPSIEALTMHELAHNHQRTMQWRQGTVEKLAKRFGWQEATDSSGERVWLFKSKEKDGSGNNKLYRYHSDNGRWYRCDSALNWLDDKGATVASRDKAQELKRQDMREKALCKPMTYYFVNPTEMFAEGFMCYRLGGQYRASLLTTNPSLYEVAKEQDQLEIDQIFGVESYEVRTFLGVYNGVEHYRVETKTRPKYLRKPDGYIGDANDANRRAVAEFEANARKQNSGSGGNGGNSGTGTKSGGTKSGAKKR